MSGLSMRVRDHADELGCLALGTLSGVVVAVSARGPVGTLGIVLGGFSAGALVMGLRIAAQDARRKDGR